MIRCVLICVSFVLVLAIISRFGLVFVAEPRKIQIWQVLQMALPLIGLLSLLFWSIQLWISNGKHRSLWLAVPFIGFSMFAIALPFWGDALGIAYPSRLASAKHSLEIRVPMDDQVVVAWGGDHVRTNYHAAFPDQRWAYDLVVDPHSIRSNRLDAYGCWGKEVKAPISGRVATAEDGEDDLLPGEMYSGRNVFGNYIVLDPSGADTRLVIAHLKKGSIRVSEGAAVNEGDLIAECGNSGASTEPHVHIHFLKIISTENEAYLIGQPLYFRDNKGPAMPIGGFHHEDGRLIAAGNIIEHLDEE